MRLITPMTQQTFRVIEYTQSWAGLPSSITRITLALLIPPPWITLVFPTHKQCCFCKIMDTNSVKSMTYLIITTLLMHVIIIRVQFPHINFRNWWNIFEVREKMASLLTRVIRITLVGRPQCIGLSSRRQNADDGRA